jgi:hypothetical protein
MEAYSRSASGMIAARADGTRPKARHMESRPWAISGLAAIEFRCRGTPRDEGRAARHRGAAAHIVLGECRSNLMLPDEILVAGKFDEPPLTSECSDVQDHVVPTASHVSV